MNTSTIYRNKSNITITPQQAQLADRYTELNFVDNELKTKLEIRNKEVFRATYYTSPNENLNDVLQNLNQEFEWYINLNKATINGYLIWESRAISDGNLSEDSNIIVYTLDDRVVAAFSYDSNGSITDAIKFFYLSGLPIIEDGTTIGYFGEDDKITFRFNAAEIEEISTNTELFYKPYTYLQRFMDEWQDRAVLNLMTPDMISYYTNILPLVPNF
ncbi:hypothetical protein [Sphingobacterium siyangense]|uniref:hypothetical protein n=1 Tax=Sphingobacterium siyangense TaxID=459529 RepID=UPI002FD988C5